MFAQTLQGPNDVRDDPIGGAVAVGDGALGDVLQHRWVEHVGPHEDQGGAHGHQRRTHMQATVHLRSKT
jgi:hypothetical protein